MKKTLFPVIVVISLLAMMLSACSGILNVPTEPATEPPTEHPIEVSTDPPFVEPTKPVDIFDQYAFEGGYEYGYSVDSGKAIIISVDDSISGDVIIPSTLGGYSVVGIYLPNVFKADEAVTSITIPNTVVYIDNDAFRSCINLTGIWVDENNPAYSSDEKGVLYDKEKNLLIQATKAITGTYTIPEGVKSIVWRAFYACDNLKEIRIPASVSSINYQSFYPCQNLTGIWVDEKNPVYSSDDKGVLFNKDKTVLLKAPTGYTGIYTIPDSVKRIEDIAFYDCIRLTKITIPNGVTYIGESAFSGCGVVELTIPDSVTQISDYAFWRCFDLDNIRIGSGVTTIGKEVFVFTQIWVDEQNPVYSSDDRGVLYNKEKTVLLHVPEIIDDSYTIPKTVTRIESNAFLICSNLTKLVIPTGVTYIAENAIVECHNLTDVRIVGSDTEIAATAIYGCESLISVELGIGVIKIGREAFGKWNTLNDVYYAGSQEDWAKIDIDSDNSNLFNATITYNYVAP